MPVMGALKKEKEIHKMRRYKRMTRRRLWLFAPLGLVILGLVCSDASAWEKRRSGKYKGRRSSGTFQQKVYRERGTVTRDTKWQNERGEGSRRSERVWDREEGTGAYSSSRTRPDGRTTSGTGTLTRREDGSFRQEGTIARPTGKVTGVERDFSRNDDGTRSIHTTYTGPEGETLTVDKKVKKTATGREKTGTYVSSTDKSGTFQSDATVQDGRITRDRSLTNQDQKTWKRHIETMKEGDTTSREVTTTNPEGKQDTFTQSITFDEDTGDD